MGELCKSGIKRIKLKKSIVVILVVFTLYHYTYYEGVRVYTNGVFYKSRNLGEDNYNLGLKWQCVEFVKRFYYEKYNHKMPNTYGHAISYYNKNTKSNSINKERNLLQINNSGKNYPDKNDIIVIRTKTRYGHVAIAIKSIGGYVLVVQQNSLLKYSIIKIDENILCWLRKIN